MSRIALVVSLIVLAARAHAGEPRPIAIMPAMGAVQAGRSLAIWAPDLRSVLGYDAGGKRLWRLPTGDQGGQRDLAVIGGNVLVYAGTEAVLLAPDDGRVLGRRADVVLGSPGGPRGCRVREVEGACALACECRFEVVACASLKALGDPARLPRFEERDEDGRMQSHCPMFSGALLGRAGDVVMTSFPAATDKPFFSVPELTVARHATSGAEVWRSSELGFFDEQLSGVAADGVCYAGSRTGAVLGFECASGAVQWRRTAKLIKGGEPQVEARSGGLLVRDGTRVALLAQRSGVATWEREVPADAIVLLAGASRSEAGADRRLSKGVTGARILAPADGEQRGQLAFPAGTERWPRALGDGWVVMGAKRIELFDSTGRSLGAITTSGSWSDYLLGDGANLAAWDASAVRVKTLPARRSPWLLSGEGLSVVGFEGALGAGGLALLSDGLGPWDPKNPSTFGELRLYRFGP